MVSRVQILRPGDSNLLPGDFVDRLELKRMNEKLLVEGKRIAKSIDVLLGITKASLSTDSFLSASSFQHTIKVLAGAAIAATEDPLYGLKENVIIGKLIPAGTGFERGRFVENEKKVETQGVESPLVVAEDIDLTGPDILPTAAD